MSDDSVNINVTENSKNTENKELPSIDEETETSSNNTTQPGSPTTNNVDDTKSQQIDLLTVDIKDENTALNVMVGFLGVAQRRGCFAINESAKIHECINKFHRTN
jgi:glutathione synthase/RimK-type ligase-like ATP-grasp enzyme